MRPGTGPEGRRRQACAKPAFHCFVAGTQRVSMWKEGALKVGLLYCAVVRAEVPRA